MKLTKVTLSVATLLTNLSGAYAANSVAPSSPTAAVMPADLPDEGDTSADAILARVTDYHRGPGPWAVAGFRMGLRMLKELGLSHRNDFALQVTHRSPPEVQYTCILDGVQAATGASLGKMNLSFVPDRDVGHMQTVAVNVKTGKRATLRVTPDLAQSLLNVPYTEHERVSRELLAKSDDELFSVTVDRQP